MHNNGIHGGRSHLIEGSMRICACVDQQQSGCKFVAFTPTTAKLHVDLLMCYSELVAIENDAYNHEYHAG